MLATEATFIDRMNAAKRYKPSAADYAAGLATKIPDANPRPAKPKQGASGNHSNSNRPNSSSTGKSSSGSKKRSRKFPNCLNPKCDKQHFLRDCETTSEEEKAKLKEEYRRAKPAKKDHQRGVIGSIVGETQDENTALFMCTFCNGKIDAKILADQGADANIISREISNLMLEADSSLSVTSTEKTIYLSNAAVSAQPIQCNEDIQADVCLRIRDGSHLILRRIKWLVTKEELQHIFLSRHVLSALGLDNRVLLAAAADRRNGVMDIPSALADIGRPNSACANMDAPS